MGRERLRQYIPPLSDEKYQAQTAVYLCDVFAQRNINRTIAQQMARWPKAIEEAKAKGAKAAGIGISASWGSNWTGEVTQADRMTMLERQYRLWEEAGIPVTKVGISDPMGWNMPDQVERQIVAIKQRWPSIKSFNLHLHDTRGMALTSSYVCLKTLDATDTLLLQPAIGGMGGCPFCGNGRSAGLAPTEDLIHMLEGMGIETGVDLYKLIECVWMAEEMVGHPLWGHVSKSGPRPKGKKTLCHGYALRRNSGARPPLHQRTCGIPRRALTVERDNQEPAASRDHELRRRFAGRIGPRASRRCKMVTFVISNRP
jgi:hydroxymethylglutaryl-CoA lyase